MNIYRFLSLSISSFRSQKVSGNEVSHQQRAVHPSTPGGVRTDPADHNGGKGVPWALSSRPSGSDDGCTFTRQFQLVDAVLDPPASRLGYPADRRATTGISAPYGAPWSPTADAVRQAAPRAGVSPGAPVSRCGP